MDEERRKRILDEIAKGNRENEKMRNGTSYEKGSQFLNFARRRNNLHKMPTQTYEMKFIIERSSRNSLQSYFWPALVIDASHDVYIFCLPHDNLGSRARRQFCGALLGCSMAIPISGSRGGFWLYVGWNRDGEMISDYVPCSAEGRPICISKGKNNYWNFHLPGKRTTVSFHRQLWRDLHGGARLSSRLEVNHLDRNPNHNCSFNLDGRVLVR